VKYTAGDYEYWIATRTDEPVVRDILAHVATGGRMQLAFQREPDAFGAHFGALSQDFVLARNRRSGEHVGVCERVVRPAFVNGEIRRLPYLAALRVIPNFRHRLLVLRGGFEAVRRLTGHEADLPFALTSIMADNAQARRVLSANLRGMPAYEPLGEFSTFVLAARPDAARGAAVPARARLEDLPAISQLLMATARHRQFGNVWTLDALNEAIGSGWIALDDFFVLRRDGAVAACAALWDQSRYRQLVVSGYSGVLKRARPLINAATHLLGLPKLPAPGQVLRSAYLSHLACDDAAPGDLLALVAAARGEARRRGIELLLAGCAPDDPRAAALRKLPRQREFRSLLYRVRWPDEEVITLDAKPPASPELALL
jgi:hypothetical protein